MKNCFCIHVYATIEAKTLEKRIKHIFMPYAIVSYKQCWWIVDSLVFIGKTPYHIHIYNYQTAIGYSDRVGQWVYDIT